MKRSVLYARVGFAFQNEKPNRLQEQISAMKIYCLDNNITVEGIYYEIAPAMNFKRKEFQNLLKDLENKKVKPDFLLFTEWHRLSTNIEETIKTYKWLAKKSVEAKAINDKDNSEAFLKILKLLKK